MPIRVPDVGNGSPKMAGDSCIRGTGIMRIVSISWMKGGACHGNEYCCLEYSL